MTAADQRAPWPPPPPRHGWSSPYPPPPSPPPPPPARQGRNWLRTAGGVLLVILYLVFRFVLPFVVDRDEDDDRRQTTTRGTWPTDPFADTKAARLLPPGTCIDRAPVQPVRVVPCDQSHLAEIVAVFPYVAGPGGAYPGVLEAYRQASDRCRSEFLAFTGTTPDQTPAGYYVAVPVEFEWDRGERLVVCYASGRNGVQLTGSLRAR